MAVSKVDLANQVENSLPNSLLSAGTVVQLKSTTWSTGTYSSSSTYADITGASLSITPSSSSNKIHIMFSLAGMRKETNNTYYGIKLFRQINSGGYSEIEKFENGLAFTGTTVRLSIAASYAYLDSPATTDQVDYKLQFNSGGNAAQVSINNDQQESSSITLMEVVA